MVRVMPPRAPSSTEKETNVNMSKIRKLIAKYPIITVAATAAATYYGGPAGAAILANIAKAIGLGG